jgi:hypothetical protein
MKFYFDDDILDECFLDINVNYTDRGLFLKTYLHKNSHLSFFLQTKIEETCELYKNVVVDEGLKRFIDLLNKIKKEYQNKCEQHKVKADKFNDLLEELIK